MIASRRWLHAAPAAALTAGLAVLPGCGGPSSTPVIPPGGTTPASAPTVVLGRPTSTSIVASTIADAGAEVYFDYGTASGSYTGRTLSATGVAATPVLVSFTGLQPNSRYYYRARYKRASDTAYQAGAEGTFHTQRPSGQTFTFVIEADPHLDSNSSGTVYRQALLNQLADQPDFMVDLGDTSMVEKCAIVGSDLCVTGSPATADTVRARYALVRSYLETSGHSVPLFMVLGNHDGENGWTGDPGAANLDTWSVTARKTFFANPEPDAFYSGSGETSPGVGLRENYYAFEWGDALFVALDPYTYTSPKPNANGWGWTLGATQYQWLARTLAASHARFKFVFSHHLVGGNTQDARGGVAFAPYYEWGGRNVDGTWGFDTTRPGWTAPLHQLFVDNHVTAWFHGHDHLYAREELDGIVYQEVPQPGQAQYDNPNPGAGYGYVGTVGVNIFPSSGHLRVTVGPSEVRVEYVRAVAPADQTPTRVNAAVVTSYVIR